MLLSDTQRTPNSWCIINQSIDEWKYQVPAISLSEEVSSIPIKLLSWLCLSLEVRTQQRRSAASPPKGQWLPMAVTTQEGRSQPCAAMASPGSLISYVVTYASAEMWVRLHSNRKAGGIWWGRSLKKKKQFLLLVKKWMFCTGKTACNQRGWKMENASSQKSKLCRVGLPIPHT